MSASSWLKLAHQTAIITGAGSGIGKAVTLALAKQGCNILLADIDHHDLDTVAMACRRATNEKILIRTSLCDVTDKSQVQAALSDADELASEDLESPCAVTSILVNCAGITRDKKISHLSETDWDDVLNINLKGTFLTCQAFCEVNRLELLLRGNSTRTSKSCGSSDSMRASGGSIINVGSIVSEYGNIGQCNYAASKGGVVSFTRSLAKEMALMSCKIVDSISFVEYEQMPAVRVNCIQPGFIRTPMVQAVPDVILSEVTRRIALRRMGKPEDVANLALFLASAECSGYITGEVIECSGMLRL